MAQKRLHNTKVPCQSFSSMKKNTEQHELQEKIDIMILEKCGFLARHFYKTSVQPRTLSRDSNSNWYQSFSLFLSIYTSGPCVFNKGLNIFATVSCYYTVLRKHLLSHFKKLVYFVNKSK